MESRKNEKKSCLLPCHQSLMTFLLPPFLTNGMKSAICSLIFHNVSFYCLVIIYFALDLVTEGDYIFLGAGTLRLQPTIVPSRNYCGLLAIFFFVSGFFNLFYEISTLTFHSYKMAVLEIFGPFS